MNVHERHEYSVVCQECYEDSGPWDSERQAVKIATGDGFVEVEGRTLCADCAPKPAKHGKVWK